MVHVHPGFLDRYFDREITNCSLLSVLNDNELEIFLTGTGDRAFMSEVRDSFCVEVGIHSDNIEKNFAVVCDELAEDLDKNGFFSSVGTRFHHDQPHFRKHLMNDDMMLITEVINNPDSCDWTRLYQFYAFVGVVSLLCLLAALYVYIAIKEYITLHGKIVIANIISTILVHVFYLIVFNKQFHVPHDDGRVGVHMTRTRYEDSNCVVLGYFGYLANLAMFSWMSVMCLDLTWTFYKGQIVQGGQKRKLTLYFCAGNGVPLVFTILSGILQVIAR